MPARLWTHQAVIAAIRTAALHGRPLHYSSMQARQPALLRAAERIFGNWSSAVEAAGFDYTQIRRYRTWTRERVIERIRYWHAQQADLSWRHVATQLDPSLAAAALHGNRFRSWPEALEAAGLAPETVARYRRWTLALIARELNELALQGLPLDGETLMRWAPDLRAAIYRIAGGLELHQRASLLQQHAGTAENPVTSPEAAVHPPESAQDD